MILKETTEDWKEKVLNPKHEWVNRALRWATYNMDMKDGVTYHMFSAPVSTFYDTHGSILSWLRNHRGEYKKFLEENKLKMETYDIDIIKNYREKDDTEEIKINSLF